MLRHAVLSPSVFDSYASAAFPGIADFMYDFDKLTGTALATRQEDIRKHVSLLTIMTQRAAGILSDLHKFE